LAHNYTTAKIELKTFCQNTTHWTTLKTTLAKQIKVSQRWALAKVFQDFQGHRSKRSNTTYFLVKNVPKYKNNIE
jgi:hypothetical protein